MLGVCVRTCVSLLVCGAVFAAGEALVPSLEYATSYETHAQLSVFGPASSDPLAKSANTTDFVQEYHDLQENVGRIDFVIGGARRQHFYFIKEHRTATISETGFNCTQHTLRGFLNETEFEEANMYNKTFGIIGPSAALWNAKSVISEDGVFIIRGIPCTRKKTIHIPSLLDFGGEIITTYYYISFSNWISVHGLKEAVPIRIESKRENNVTMAILDFTFFEVNTSNSLASTFLIPLHVGCPDLTVDENTRLDRDVDKEDLSNIIYYADEVTDLFAEKEKAGAFTILEKTWIDERNRLIKFDSVNSYTKMSYSSILDFNTGVVYETDSSGRCFVKHLYSVPIFEKKFKGSTSSSKSVSEILLLDRDFNYIGQTLHRNIHCNVFEAIDYNISYAGQFYQRLVYTYFVMTPEYKSAAYPNARNVLVALDVTGYLGENVKEAMQFEKDYFEFRQFSDWPKGSGMNIENCFTKEGRNKYFAIYFPLNDTTHPLVEQKRDNFFLNAKILLMQVAKISFLRLPYFKMYLDRENVIIVGKILDKPPVLAGFSPGRISKGFITGQQGPTTKRFSEACAIECERSSNSCRGFTYCVKGEVRDCYLTTDNVTDDAAVQTREGCLNYNRGVMDSNLKEDTLDVAMQNLFNKVHEKKFLVPVTNDKRVNVEITASKMERDVHPFDAKRSSSKYESVYQYRQLVPNFHDIFQIEEQVLSEDNCFRECVKDPAITCSSFSYCAQTKACHISSKTLRNVTYPFDFTNFTTLCTVFRRKSLELFSASPGLVPLTRGDKSFQGVEAHECASKCLDEKEFTCQGFESCDNQCVLHKTHILDVVDTSDTPEPACTHYYLNYSVSLKYVSNVLVRDTIVNYRDMTLEECAKICFDPSLKCRSINYCSAVPGALPFTCAINTKGFFDDGVATEKNASELCHNYEKWGQVPYRFPTNPTTLSTTPSTTPTTPTTISDSTDNSSSVTSSTASTGETTVETLVTEKHVRQGVERGAFTGAVIGMLIFGIVVGALGFLGYSYYRSRRADDGISVRFTKHQS